MSKLDLLKEYKSYYNAGKNPEIVEFDEANYLTIEGIGVPKLESLWWVAGDIPALEIPRSEWRWKLLIRMSEFITKELMFSVQVERVSLSMTRPKKKP